MLELRGGLLGIERESQRNAYFSPLLRANLGLPYNAEFYLKAFAVGGGLDAVGSREVEIE